MGQKYLSKRKPKKSNPVTGDSSIIGNNKRPGGQTPIGNKVPSTNRGGVNPSSGMNKNQRKGG